jgi:hypothetical protein
MYTPIGSSPGCILSTSTKEVIMTNAQLKAQVAELQAQIQANQEQPNDVFAMANNVMAGTCSLTRIFRMFCEGTESVAGTGIRGIENVVSTMDVRTRAALTKAEAEAEAI